MRILILLLFASATLFYACEDDPCDNIVCLNGGTCANGLCNCPDGYEGSDCSEAIIPSKITITGIRAPEWPLTDNNSVSWDLFDAADVYVSISNESGTEVGRTSVLNNSTPPSSWGASIVINDPAEKTYNIRLFDEDLFSPPDDYIGGFWWDIGVYARNNNFPTTAVISDPSTSVSFEVDLLYDF